MLFMGLTRVVLPLVELLQFPLQKLFIAGLDVDLLVGRFPRNGGLRLVRRFDICSAPIVRILMSSSSNDQPSLELVRSGKCHGIAL